MFQRGWIHVATAVSVACKYFVEEQRRALVAAHVLPLALSKPDSLNMIVNKER